MIVNHSTIKSKLEELQNEYNENICFVYESPKTVTNAQRTSQIPWSQKPKDLQIINLE